MILVQFSLAISGGFSRLTCWAQSVSMANERRCLLYSMALEYSAFYLHPGRKWDSFLTKQLGWKLQCYSRKFRMWENSIIGFTELRIFWCFFCLGVTAGSAKQHPLNLKLLEETRGFSQLRSAPGCLGDQRLHTFSTFSRRMGRWSTNLGSSQKRSFWYPPIWCVRKWFRKSFSQNDHN